MGKQRLLIVEDDFMVRGLISAIARDIGFDVDEADDGLEGLKLINSGIAFEIIIVDLMMPNMGGIEFLKTIKAISPPPVIIVITAYGSVETAREAMLNGAFEYLTKPLDITLLESTLEAAISTKNLLDEYHEIAAKLPGVLIIDSVLYDDHIKGMVKGAGYDVTFVPTGAEGLRILERKHFDIIISSTEILEMDVVAFMANVKGLDPEIAVIFMSDNPDINSIVGAMKSGAYDFLFKPVYTDNLWTVVKNVWERKVSNDKAKTVMQKLQLVNSGLKFVENMETKLEFVDEIISLIPTMIFTMFGACILKLWVRDHSRGKDEIRLLFQKGYEIEGTIERLKSGDGLTGRVYQSGKALYNVDPSDCQFADSQWIAENNVANCNIIPLKTAGDTVGVLSVFFTDKSRILRDYEKEMLQSICDISAITLKNSMLFEKVRKDTITDPLTGIKNRRYANMRLEEEWRRAKRGDCSNFAIALCDVDNFKMINDTAGHAVGDAVLQHISRVLSDAIRTTDIAARYGGDEFLIILPGTDCSGAEKLVKKVINKIAVGNRQGSPILVDLPVEISATFGISCSNCTGDNLSDLLLNADACLYESKYKQGEHLITYEKLLCQKPDYKNNTLAVAMPSKREIIDKMVITLSNLADFKDGLGRNHSRLVATLAVQIGEYLSLSERTINRIRLGGFLHAIGKLGIPITILNKDSKLTEDEMDTIKKHPRIGTWIISSIYKLGDMHELKELIPIIRAVRERWDGKGYPDGLKDDEIPLESRIISLVDAYATMVSDRAHRKRMESKAAIETIIINSGTQFDPIIVEAFLKVREQQSLSA